MCGLLIVGWFVSGVFLVFFLGDRGTTEPIGRWSTVCLSACSSCTPGAPRIHFLDRGSTAWSPGGHRAFSGRCPTVCHVFGMSSAPNITRRGCVHSWDAVECWECHSRCVFCHGNGIVSRPEGPCARPGRLHSFGVTPLGVCLVAVRFAFFAFTWRNLPRL